MADTEVAAKTADTEVSTKTADTEVPAKTADTEVSAKTADTEVSDLEAKIIRQIEYYFGDVNILKDKYLLGLVQEDDGWVTLETMLRFNRLKKLSEDTNVICTALKKSTNNLMEVNEAGDKIRRVVSKPVPEDTKERRSEMNARTIYAKSFPLELTMDDMTEYFETYGPVESVHLKKNYNTKDFKGSVFCTFKKLEDAEKYIKEEGTKFKDTVIEKKLFRIDYMREKNKKEKEEKAVKKDTSNGQRQQREKITEENAEEKAKTQMTKNAVLHFKGLDPTTSREDIKSYFVDIAEVGWVDHDKGKTEGFVRFREPNSAEPALKKAKESNDGKVVICDKEVEMRVIEGDEELEYWTRMFKDIAARDERNKNFRRGGRGGGRGGKFQRGGRRNRGGPQGKRRNDNGDAGSGGEEERDEPVHKAAKVDDSTE